MALPTIYGVIELPAGQPGSQVEAFLELIAAVDGTALGHADVASVGGVRRVRLDATGRFEFDSVRPNNGAAPDAITSPAGTVYRLRIRFPDGTVTTNHIAVPDTAGPHLFSDILSIAPDALLDSPVRVALDELRSWSGSRRVYSPPLARWAKALYLAEAGTAPAKIVRIGDSHGEVGVDMPFQAIFNNYLNKKTSYGWSGYWIAATTSLTHSGAVASAAGPVGYGVALDSGDYVQFGDGLFVQNTGWQVYGTGLVTIEVRNGGTPVETWTGTLAADVPWVSSITNLVSYTCRVTAGAGGATAWGAFVEVDNRTSGYQQWGFNHSGWSSALALASSSTWTMLDAVNPDLVILAMATNEPSAESYRDGTEAMIALARAADPARSVALWFPHMSSASGDDEDWWDAAHDYFLELCHEHNCLPLDMYALFGDLSTSDPHDLCSGDNVHLSAQGAQVYSRVQAEALLPLALTTRFVDAVGVRAAEAIRLKNTLTPAHPDVLLFAGQSGGGGGEMVSLVRHDLSGWVPLGVGTPTNPVHAATKSYVDGAKNFTEQAPPSSPAANTITLYAADSSGTTVLRTKDSAGTVTTLGFGSGTVTAVSGTAPIVSSGGATPAISITAASDSASGAVELATTAETQTGTDATRAVTPAGGAATYQPLDGELTAIAGLTSAADKGIQFTGAGTAATFDLTAAGKALLDDATVAGQRTTLGLWEPTLSSSGVYIAANGTRTGSITNAAWDAAGDVVAAPVWIPARTYDRIGIYYYAAGTSTLRLGVWNMGSAGWPGTVALDAGTVSVTAADGVVRKEITTSQAFTAGWYWVGMQVDAYTSTAAMIGYQAGNALGLLPGARSSADTNQAYSGVLQTGATTGSLATWGSTITLAGVAPMVYLRSA